MSRAEGIKELEEWVKYLEIYDPYAPSGVSQYGSAAAVIEAEGIKEKVKSILEKFKEDEE